MLNVSIASKSVQSVMASLLVTVSMGTQVVQAAQKAVFIGTADIGMDTAVRRCSNIAASIGAAPQVSVNYLGLKQCNVITDKQLTDRQSQQFGAHFVYGSAL